MENEESRLWGFSEPAPIVFWLQTAQTSAVIHDGARLSSVSAVLCLGCPLSRLSSVSVEQREVEAGLLRKSDLSYERFAEMLAAQGDES